MLPFKQTNVNEYFVSISSHWIGQVKNLEDLVEAFKPYTKTETTFYIELVEIDALPGTIFNQFYELAIYIASMGGKLIFTNVHDNIAERIGMLCFSAE